MIISYVKMKSNYLLIVLLPFTLLDIVTHVGGVTTPKEKSEAIIDGAQKISDLKNETSTNGTRIGNANSSPLDASANELLSAKKEVHFEVERMYGGGEIRDCMVCGIRLPSADMLQLHLTKHFPEEDEQSESSVGRPYSPPVNVHGVIQNYACPCGIVSPTYESYVSHSLHLHGIRVEAEREPPTSTPAVSKPAMCGPAVSRRPTMSRPIMCRPATSRPATSRPATCRPTMCRPIMCSPATSRPATPRPATPRPAPSNNTSTPQRATAFTRPTGPVRCPKCRYETKVVENMAGHIRTRHASCRTEALNCPVCFNEYTNTSTLADHLELQHDSNAPPPPTPVRGSNRETYPVRNGVINMDETPQAHFINQHPHVIGIQNPQTENVQPQQQPSKAHQCPLCGEDFRSAEAALKHVYISHKEGPVITQPENTPEVEQQQASANVTRDHQNRYSLNRQNSHASVGSSSRETGYYTPIGSFSRQTTMDSINRESSSNFPGSPISIETTMGHLSRPSNSAQSILGNLSRHSSNSSMSASSSRSSRNSSHDFSEYATDSSEGTSSAATDYVSRANTSPHANVFGSFLEQSKKELDVAVKWLKMGKKDAKKYMDELNHAECLGIDSGHTFVGGIAAGIKEASSKTQWPKVTFANVVENMDFYGTSYGDRGWGCGYRNLQMIWSSLLENPLYSEIVRNKMEDFRIADTTCVPSIDKLQAMIQNAWEQGFDPQGRQHFQGKVRSTRKCIGPAEIVTVLSSMGIKCEWIHTTSPSALIKWITDYFTKTGLKPRTPMFFQVPGHSKLIVGMELIKNEATDELIVDPDNRKSDMNDIAQYKKHGMAARRAVSKLRFNMFKFKQDRYQMVRVVGVMKSRAEYQESKNMKPKLYSTKD